MKASYKQLKAILALGIKIFALAFILPKLSKFPIFDNFFPDLADFWDLNDFFDFLKNFLPPLTPNLLILPSPTLSHSKVKLSGNIIVFSIEVSRTAILLKLWINH